MLVYCKVNFLRVIDEMVICNLKKIDIFLFDLDVMLYLKEIGVLDIFWGMLFDFIE